jgi:hypothetical protein
MVFALPSMTTRNPFRAKTRKPSAGNRVAKGSCGLAITIP